MKDKHCVVIRFGINDHFTDADIDNLLHEFREFLESKYNDKIQGVLEMGYEKVKFNPLMLIS